MLAISAITDQYFFDNNYWVHGEDEKRASYPIIVPTEKWRKLIDTCLRNNGVNKLIPMQLIVDSINADDLKRNKPHKKRYYDLKVRPADYQTVAERKANRNLKQRIRRHNKALAARTKKK